MITEAQYKDAQKIVFEWLNSQPPHSEYPFKPKIANVDDYVRKRALNEILRLFRKKETISFNDFGEILDRFDLHICIAQNAKNEEVVFIQYSEDIAINGERVKPNYKTPNIIVSQLTENEIN